MDGPRCDRWVGVTYKSIKKVASEPATSTFFYHHGYDASHDGCDEIESYQVCARRIDAAYTHFELSIPT